jgi:hypothetical protein
VRRPVEDWTPEVFLERGPQADEIRIRALAKLAIDPSRLPDHLFAGPEIPFDASTRARLFGDDQECRLLLKFSFPTASSVRLDVPRFDGHSEERESAR